MIDLTSSVQTLWESHVQDRRIRPPAEPGRTAVCSPPLRGDSISPSLAPPSLRSGVHARLVGQGRLVRPSSRRPGAIDRSPTVRDLPPDERPRERLAALGPQALSSIELLACLLGRGTSGEPVLTIAQRLLARFESPRGIAEASVEELQQVRGVGLAKACQLKAAAELGRRVEMTPESPRGRPIETVEAAGRAARRFLAGRKKEHFILILLDSRHRVLKTAEISVGSLDMSVVHPRETFREAITARASAIILAHNHPSGDSAPSREDLELTRRLTEAGRLLGIPVLDHLIVAGRGALSLRGAGFLDKEG